MKRDYEDEDMSFIKFQWAERWCTPEVDVVRRFEDCRNGNPFVEGHITEAIDEVGLEGYDVKGEVWRQFRATLLEGQEKQTSACGRVLRALLERRMRPITELSGGKLQRALWDIFYRHFFLWADGIHHGDISVANLKYYQDPNGGVTGVLIDFDLSTTEEESNNHERTGTMPFMALERLSHRGWMGHHEHLYIYDAESFLWVITYIMNAYDAKGELDRAATCYQEWCGVSYDTCAEKKAHWLREKEMSLQPNHENDRAWLMSLARFWDRRHMVWRLALQDQEIAGKPPPEPQTDLECFKSLFGLIPAEDKEELEAYLDALVT